MKSHRLLGTAVLAILVAGLLAAPAAEGKAFRVPPYPAPPVLAPAYCPPPCPTTKTILLEVQNPNCPHDCATVKVCVPACCEGVPTVCARCGVLGRGLVTYEWCCGHRVTVVFTAVGTVRVRPF